MNHSIADIFDPQTPYYESDGFALLCRQELQASHSSNLRKYTYHSPTPTSIATAGVYQRISSRIQNFFHSLMGSFMSLSGRAFLRLSGTASLSNSQYRSLAFSNQNQENPWLFKRIALQVHRYDIAGNQVTETIDAVIIGKPSTWNNGKWLVPTYGLGRSYERVFEDFQTPSQGLLPQLLSNLSCNAIVFNYPGVGESSGSLTREGMVQSYLAALHLLEDKTKGIGAKQIISMGHSIGGAVQDEAIGRHSLKSDINYIFVKYLAFSTLRKTLSDLIGSPVGWLVDLVGWNMSCIRNVSERRCPEVIIQTAQLESFGPIRSSHEITHDGVISAEASLARNSLEVEQTETSLRLVVGFPGNHNDRFGRWAENLSSIIQRFLEERGHALL